MTVPGHTTGEHAADELTSRLKRTELQRSASSLPGRDIVQVLTEIPVGVASGWHVHPGEEIGYILAGRVHMEIQDRPALILDAGDPFLIPPRVPHNATDLGPDIGRMLSTYLVEAGSRWRRSSDDPFGPHARPRTRRRTKGVRQSTKVGRCEAGTAGQRRSTHL